MRQGRNIPAAAGRLLRFVLGASSSNSVINLKETAMQWTTPTASDFRFGFEITMYVAAR